MAVMGLSAVALLAIAHVTQGTAAVETADVWNLATGRGTNDAAAVVVASRLPRLLAGVLVGVALVAGPIGFVELCAPALIRLISPLAPGLYRHAVLVPMASVAGVVVVLGADVVLWARWARRAASRSPPV